MFFPPFFKPYLEDFQMFWILKKTTTTKNRKVKGGTPREEASRQVHKTVF